MPKKPDRSQQSLGELESRYELILAAIPDILMETDADKVYTWTNNAGYDFFGDDVIGKPADYYFEGDQNTYEKVRPLFDGQQDLVCVESWQRRRDGEKRLLSWLCRPRLDVKGHVVGALSSARDITDYQRVLDELSVRNRELNIITSNSPDVIFAMTKGGTLSFVSPATRIIFGYDPKEMIGQSFTKFIAEKELARCWKAIEEVLRNGQLYNFETVGIGKNGEGFPIEVNALILSTEEGPAIRGALRDITKRKKAEEELKRHQGNLEELVKEKTRVLNEKVEKLDRSQRAMLYMVEDLNATRDSLKRSHDELEIRVKERTAELEQAYKELDFAHRKFVKSQIQLMQSEKMNAIGGLVAGVAHELNNPMMGILNYVQYCRKHTPNKDKKHAVLEDAETEIKRCVDIVDSLLTFSHMDKEGAEEPKDVEFARVLERALMFVAHRINRERATIDKKCSPEVLKVRMRVNRIQQILLNLLNNALDALKESEKKEISIEVVREDDYIVFSIADTGPGIPKDVFAHIYEPFFTTKPVGHGTGLGLSLTKSIVEEEGGTIHCRSKEGKGTKFTVRLPIDEGRKGRKGKER